MWPCGWMLRILMHKQQHINNGGAISEWTDLSGNGYNMTAYDSPVLNASGFGAGLPSVQFDGSNDYVQNAGDIGTKSEVTMFIVTNKPSYVGNSYKKIFMTGTKSGGVLSSGILLSEGSSAQYRLYLWGTLAPNAGTQESINTGDYTSGVLIHQITKDASTISWNINGNDIQSSASVGNVGNSVTTTIGWAYGNEYWDGHVAEVIYINKKIEDDESMKIRAYLANKWGMAATVDSDGDGIVDASDQAPVNQDRVVVDLSDTIDSTLGTTTGLDSLESDLRFG